MYFTEKERDVIRKFYISLDLYTGEPLTLRWGASDEVIAEFDTCFEDDNGIEIGEEGYEEFTSFVFRSIHTYGNPPVVISPDELFLVDYRNFPDEIIANGKKIN